MPQCHALRTDGHPCRGHGSLSSTPAGEGYLCHMHRTYFDATNADQAIRRLTHSFMTAEEREWIIRVLQSPLYPRDPKRIVAALEADFTGPRPFAKLRAKYLYDLYVQAGVVAPLASLKLWMQCLHHNLVTIACSCKVAAAQESSPVEIPPHIGSLTYIFFGHLLKGLPPTVVYPYLFDFMQQPLDLPPALHTNRSQLAVACAAVWKVLMKEITPFTSNRILATYPLESLLQKIDAKQKATPQSTWWHPGVRDEFATILKQLQLGQRLLARKRFNPLREELMIAAWHPRRVERWLEAGIDPENM